MSALSNTVAVLLSTCCLVAGSHASATSYSFQILSSLGGDSRASAINNLGQVVGYSSLSKSGIGQHATLWSGGTLTDLGAFSGYAQSGASDINDAGMIVGSSGNGYGNTVAVTWSGGAITALQSLDGAGPILGNNSANGINNAGQIVGVSSLPGSAARSQAVSWSGGVVSALATLEDVNSDANAINNAGQIVGWSYMNGSSSVTVPTLWQGTDIHVMQNIGTDSGSQTVAYGINDYGQAVGSAWNMSLGLFYRAALISDTSFSTLGVLPGSLYSNAYAINNAGQVVGQSVNRAFIWNGSSMEDLNDYLDPATVTAGWTLESANDINDQGWIVGSARNSKTGDTRAYLLAVTTPVPELPAVYLMIAGGALLASMRRERA